VNKKDLFLIGAIFLIAGGIFLFNFFQNEEVIASEAQVSVRGEILYRFSLEQDGIFELSATPLTIEIRNGRAAVIEACCPDQLCVGFGFIGEPSQTSICLPNQTILSITGESEIDMFL